MQNAPAINARHTMQYEVKVQKLSHQDISDHDQHPLVGVTKIAGDSCVYLLEKLLTHQRSNTLICCHCHDVT